MRKLLCISLLLTLLTACNNKNNNDSVTAIAGSVGWDLNDVSILYPVSNETYPELIGMVNLMSDGSRRVLFEKGTFDLLGTQTIPLTESNESVYRRHYDNLRVTAVRIDPCLEAIATPSKSCQSVIRVVAQPIARVNGGSLKVYDASIHLFYELRGSEFTQFVAEYNRLRGTSTPGALYVHPALQQENLNGPFSHGLKNLLLNSLEPSKLIKFTFMATNQAGDVWTWGGFYRNDSLESSLRPIQIPLIGTTTDAFPFKTRTQVPQGLGHDTALFPDSLLWNPSAQSQNINRFASNIARIQKIENPVISSSSNTTCASCHKANSAKHYSLEWKKTSESLQSAWLPKGNYNMKLMFQPSTSEDGRNFHAFSYFGTTPTVSQRVVNESALVADYLNNLR